MNRDDLEFDIHYSFFIEKMNYTLLNRIDKGITLVLIVLGFSVFAPYNNMFLFGVAVAILSVLQLVYQFGQEAGLSKEQMRQYKRMLVEFSTLSDDDLRTRYLKIQDADSNPWQSLQDAAFKRTCIALGRKDDTELSFFHRVIAWLAGDLPRN
ncbi:hypothetical protein [Enterobacter hormaechei]|uniref:hypothetical protein n=1 Tax=Enterobacter hormaechei TaxID=158836 RepID=UPI000755A8F6|nr:hypothetical protein [Enterobacter hormaechei]CAE7093177.1 hypothetical protein AI2683V1_2763 [Enterobacter cloacae]KVK02786.1 hypothetical protein AWS20_02985 [Enterobacter hormaechei subsp. xiangfangensis]MBK4661976.1 hypothetical protein [Enterobacter hormaechei]MBK4679734.1 hypothetical protein [Enterobacter hormaechei]MBK4688928.1 hypothetical protein [Enterobacter hormaechei]